MGKQQTTTARVPGIISSGRGGGAFGAVPTQRRWWSGSASNSLSAGHGSAQPVRVVTLVLLIGLVIELGVTFEVTPVGPGGRWQAVVHQEREALRLELDALSSFREGLMAPEAVGRGSVVDLVTRQQSLLEAGHTRAAARLGHRIAILNGAIRGGGATQEQLDGAEQSRATLESLLEPANEGR